MKYYNIKKLKHKDKFEIKYGQFEGGRCYYTLLKAINKALETKKVSVIITKNKQQFFESMKEITQNLELNFEVYEDCYDIFQSNILLVKICESEVK